MAEMKLRMEIPGYSNGIVEKAVREMAIRTQCAIGALLLRKAIVPEWERLLQEILPDLKANRALFRWVAWRFVHFIYAEQLCHELEGRASPICRIELQELKLSNNLWLELAEGFIAGLNESLIIRHIGTEELQEKQSSMWSKSLSLLPQMVNAVSNSIDKEEMRLAVESYPDCEKNHCQGVLKKMEDALQGYAQWQLERKWKRYKVEDILKDLTNWASKSKDCQDVLNRPLTIQVERIEQFLASLKFQRIYSQKKLLNWGNLICKRCERTILEELGIDKNFKPESGNVENLWERFSDVASSSLSKKIENSFKDSLCQELVPEKKWAVLFSLLDVEIRDDANLSSEALGVRILSHSQTQKILDPIEISMGEEKDIKLNFAGKSGAFVRQISAGDEHRALEIAYKRLRSVIDGLLFLCPHKQYDPQMISHHVLVFDEINDGGYKEPTILFGGFLPEHEKDSDGLVVYPASAGETNRRLEIISKLDERNAINPDLVRRVLAAVHLCHKARWNKCEEERLLDYWIALETLVGTDTDDKETVGLISYRAALLSPRLKQLDRMVTYGAIRAWTREDIEGAYELRNQIIHDGLREGPRFALIIEKFASIVEEAVWTVIINIAERDMQLEDIKTLWAWIAYRNRDEEQVKGRDEI